MRIGLRSLQNNIAYAPDGSVPSAGNINNEQQQQQQNNQQQNNQQQQQNNGGNNDEIFANMWNDDAPQRNEINNQNNQQQQNNNQTQNNDNNNAANQFNDYIKNLNFSNGIDMDAIQNDLAQGNVKSLAAAMQTAGQNAYRQAILDAQKLIKQNVDQAVNSAVNKSRGMMHADTAVREMNEKYPYTKDKAIAPVAEEVLKRFLKKGQDYDTALINVDKYFKRTSELLGGNKGRPRNQGFGNNSNTGNDFMDDHADGLDFMSILSETKSDDD